MTELAQVLAALNRMEGKIDDNHKSISDRLSKHMDDEEGEIETIAETLSSYREESDRRHTALIQSIHSYMEKQEDVMSAFIHIDGKPDLLGHRDDHLTRKQFADWSADVKRDVIKTGIKAAILAFLSWAGYILWAAFLQGPKQ